MPTLPAPVLDATRLWLEKAVIGLELCPFARQAYQRGQVHLVVSAAREPSALDRDLDAALCDLVESDPRERETTLLIAPHCLKDFLDFNDYLADADIVLKRRGLEGEIQIASFHPQYQFAGTDQDDVTNFTNRAPYPTLHLLREASVERAIESVPSTDAIIERNMATLRALGIGGWRSLGVGAEGSP